MPGKGKRNKQRERDGGPICTMSRVSLFSHLYGFRFYPLVFQLSLCQTGIIILMSLLQLIYGFIRNFLYSVCKHKTLVFNRTLRSLATGM